MRNTDHGGGGTLPIATPHQDDAAPAADDLEKYLVHVAHLDTPLAMKIELLRAVRAIMQNFVDRAFGDDPMQQVGKLHGGARGKSDAEDAGVVPPVVDLPPSTLTETDDNDLTGAFRDHAGQPAKRK